MTKRTDEIWKSEEYARTYLESMHGAVPFAAEMTDAMMRIIAAKNVDVKRFLDIGCGDGRLGSAILSRYPEADGVFIDFSETMIDQAKAKLGTAGYGVKFKVCDYAKKEWTREMDGKFDVIVSGFSIHHQPDARKREIYAEIFDLLNPGGLFIHHEHIKPSSEWADRVFDDLFTDRLYKYHQSINSGKSREELYEDFMARHNDGSNILSPLDIQLQWLREIGFADVDCHMKIFELALFGGVR